MLGEWKESPVVGVILTIVIIIVIAIAIRGIMPKEDLYRIDLKCEDCGNIFEKKVSLKVKFPIKCPKCGKVSAYRAMKCNACGEIFISKPPPVLAKGEKRSPMSPGRPNCPKCGSINLSNEVKEQSPQGVPK